jgi:AAA domain-containing protein
VESPASPLGSISVAEAIANAGKAPARRLVIDPLVAREETSLLTGQPREGKTWWLLAGGLAVAYGDKLGGRFATEQTNVLYCSNEDGERVIAKRLQMLMNGLSKDQAPDTFRLFVGRGLWLDDPGWQQLLINEARAFNTGLVILDPFRSLSACVDKGPSELQPFARFQRRLISETGCGIWGGHHETKYVSGLPDNRRPAQRSSGGGLFSISDAPISIERVNDTKGLFVPDGFKHCETPDPFVVTRLIVDDAVYLMVSDAADGQTGADLALVEEVRDFLRSNPGRSGSEIAKQLRKQKGRVFDALESLRAAGAAQFVVKGKAYLWELRELCAPED